MAFTYDISTNRGKVRLLVGDKTSSTALLQDDEVDFFLTTSGNNVYLAASLAADAIAAEFSRKADTTVESVSVKYSQRAEQYRKLSARMKAQASGAGISGANVSVTGVSRDAIRTQRQDTDRVQNKFTEGRFDNPPDDYDTDDGWRYD